MTWFMLVALFAIAALIEAVDIRNISNGVNWFNAKSRCGKNGLEYDLSIVSGLEQLQNYPFWLGIIQYQVMTSWMYPLGCYHTRQNKEVTPFITTIGHCQQYCKTSQFFGYHQESVCQCLKSNDISTLQKTNLFDCNSSEISFMMVYSVFNYTVLNGTEKTCMVSTCTTDHHHLKRNPHNCNDTNDSIATVCDDTITVDNRWGVRYSQANQLCKEKNKLLLSPNICSNTLGIHAWTSAFRQEITLELVDEENVPEGLPYLCLSGTRNSTETKGVRVIPLECNALIELFVCKSDSDNVQQDSSQKNGALIGGIIGGITTIVVVAVLTLWIMWKRKNNNAMAKDMSFSATQTETRNINHVSDMEYNSDMPRNRKDTKEQKSLCMKDDKHQNENGKSIPEYSVVQKQHKEATVDSVYVSAKEDEYDELNKISSRKIHQGASNTYGFLGQSEEGEYDTTKGVLIGFANTTEDMYHSNVPNCKGSSDDTYDTANINRFR